MLQKIHTTLSCETSKPRDLGTSCPYSEMVTGVVDSRHDNAYL